jgi:hypothetical protein
MIDSILGSLAEAVRTLIWKFILWPVFLIVATPFLAVYALVSAVRRRQTFMHALSDGYSSASAFWDKWAF